MIRLTPIFVEADASAYMARMRFMEDGTVPAHYRAETIAYIKGFWHSLGDGRGNRTLKIDTAVSDEVGEPVYSDVVLTLTGRYEHDGEKFFVCGQYLVSMDDLLSHVETLFEYLLTRTRD